jgi:1-deoxy-D-xylulose-5-phosphate reductoisomerase
MKKRIAILGSTGSIGTQALEVIENNLETFSVEILTANNNADKLIEQALKFDPNIVVIANKLLYEYVSQALKHTYIKVYAGNDAIAQVVESDTVDIVLGAMVGYSGLSPIINAIKAKKTIALANKETLVVAGKIINQLAIENNVAIIPVDSEHSAIFQCLAGETLYGNNIDKIILTASGGPFRNITKQEISKVTPSQALKHPNWDMGSKVTIDSSSLMNKGLEAIEARWLFDVKPSQIEVVVHPQSIIHSMVQFQDGSVKAQLGLPDMRLPIQYALSYPKRLKSDFPKMKIDDYFNLTFEKPDIEKFPNLQLAFEAMNRCGNMPCIMNAANEIAVEAFLKEKTSFWGMSKIIENTMNKISYISNPSLNDLENTNDEARIYAQSILNL